MKDDDTVYDKVKYKMKPEEVDPRSSVVGNLNVETKEVFSITRMNMTAYSFAWPYVCFSGMINNYIFVLNVYDNTILHRIQLSEPDHHFKVLATCITSTNDLYVLAKSSKQYTVFHLDLDESNQLEHTRSINHMFK